MSDAWSRPWKQLSPDRFPARARSVASDITAQLESVRSYLFASPEQPGAGRMSMSEGHGGIAILGDRGSGKSTLLHTVCAALDDQNSNVVLPVVYPELFRETDSVLGTFLALLWDWVRQRAAPDPGASSTANAAFGLQKLIIDAAHIHAMASTPARALENSAPGPEYFDEAVAITRSSTRLHQILSEVARAVSEDSGGGLLILPIDDADLSPLGVTGMMRDLRTIGSIPGVMPIACACEADLRASWMREQGAAAHPQRVNSFPRFMEKLFPYRLRFEIEPLTADECVDFTPIGSEVSLGDLTRDFDAALATPAGASPVMGPLRTTEPSLSLVNPLPTNPRALIQVWDSLESSARQESEQARSLALRRIVQILSEPVDEVTDANGSPPYSRITTSGRSADRRHRVEFTSDDWNFYIGAGSFRAEGVAAASGSAGSPSGVRVKLRTLNGVYASLDRKATNEAALPRAEATSRVSATVVSAILAVQELVANASPLDSSSVPLYIDFNDYKFLQKIEIAGLLTDDTFITLPDLATYSSVLRGGRCWNTLVDHIRDREPDVGTILGLTLVAALSQTRGTDLRLDQDASYGDLFGEVTAMFYEVLNVNRAQRSAEHRRFLEWYVQGLPLHWHTALLPEPAIMEVVEVWSEAISHLGQDDLMTEPRALLRARVERVLDAAESSASVGDHVWIAGYLRAFDQNVDYALYRRLESVYPAWRQRLTTVRTGSAAARSLDVEPVGGSVVFSPYPTQSGVDLLDGAMSRLRRVRTAAAEGILPLGPDV